MYFTWSILSAFLVKIVGKGSEWERKIIYPSDARVILLAYCSRAASSPTRDEWRQVYAEFGRMFYFRHSTHDVWRVVEGNNWEGGIANWDRKTRTDYVYAVLRDIVIGRTAAIDNLRRFPAREMSVASTYVVDAHYNTSLMCYIRMRAHSRPESEKDIEAVIEPQNDFHYTRWCRRWWWW